MRGALELIFVLVWLANAVSYARELLEAARHGALQEVLSAEAADLINVATNGVEIIFWLVLVCGYELPFTIPVRYSVYSSNDSLARILALSNGGSGLTAAIAKIEAVRSLNNLKALYDMLHGLNMIFFICRLLKLVHFQPRLGIVTRTLAYGLKDLSHFMVIFMFSFSICACLAYLVFGGVVSQFQVRAIPSSLFFSSFSLFNLPLLSAPVYCPPLPSPQSHPAPSANTFGLSTPPPASAVPTADAWA